MLMLAYNLYILAKVLYAFAIGLLFFYMINKEKYPKGYRYLLLLSLGNLFYALAMIIVAGSKVYIIIFTLFAWLFMRFYKQKSDEFKLNEKNKDDL